MTVRFVAALAALLAMPMIAHAEETGEEGRVRRLEVNTVHGDTYLQYHGRILVARGKTEAEYSWGGTTCGTRVLDASQVALLQQALTHGLKVLPRYELGPAQHRCLVGFDFND